MPVVNIYLRLETVIWLGMWFELRFASGWSDDKSEFIYGKEAQAEVNACLSWIVGREVYLAQAGDFKRRVQ